MDGTLMSTPGAGHPLFSHRVVPPSIADPAHVDAIGDGLVPGGLPVVEVALRGAHGLRAIEATADERIARAAYTVPVVDTVGAGDAFVAGWLFELTRGAAAPQRLDTVAACGALACTGPGDWESLPTLAELVALRAGGGDPVRR